MTKTQYLVKPYYVVTTDWLYPTESGSDIDCNCTYDTLEEALEVARELCDNEFENFGQATMEDPLRPEEIKFGYIITSRMGLDDWYFAARVTKIDPNENR